MSEEEKKYNQIMSKNEMTKEEAEDIIDEMYQFKNRILGENNTIYVDRIGTVQFTNLEFASVRMLREVQCLESKVKKLEKELDKKDKVINLMAEDRSEISEPKVSKEAIIDFYYKQVEEENE